MFDDPPAELESGDSWRGVAFTDTMVVPDSLADLTLRESTWTGADLALRTITGLRCQDVLFERCDLSGVRLDGAGSTRVRFVGCRLTGAMLSATRLADVIIEDSVADLVNFRAAHATYLSIETTSLREADFYTAQLINSALLDSDLTAANFTEVRGSGLELHGSTLDSIRGAQSLTEARIDSDQLIPLGLALVAALQVEVTDRTW